MDVPFAHIKDIGECLVPLVITTRFDFNGKDATAFFNDEIYLPQTLGIEITKSKTFCVQLLGKNIFQDAAEIDVHVSLQKVKLNVLHACGS